MAAKDIHTEEILKYLSNPENDFPNRVTIAKVVLGLANSQQLYVIFTPDELQKIEQTGLEIRRSKYAPELAKVDKAMLKEAGEGDSKAAKLCYQRFEGWSEKKELEHSGPNGGPIETKTEWTIQPVKPINET